MRSLRNLLIIKFILTLVVCSPLGAAVASEVVGKVTTLIGSARVTGASGQAGGAERGIDIRAGDRIETGPGGHVHIRFVDGGLVSVRPNSRLVIEAYDGATESAPAAIKFYLEEGVVRSVTGQWGETYRDRFRLNTPIAAIGVKGTDFAVRVQGEGAQAAVFSGAIVMAPLEGECVKSLGPCGGELAVQLSAEMQGQMLEYREGVDALPRLVPVADLLGVSGTRPATRKNLRKYVEDEEELRKQSLHEARTATAVPDGEVAEGRPLIWLHNPARWNVPDKSISERYEIARAAGLQATVGNFFITLFRDETAQTEFRPLGSAASFRLTAASASYAQPVALARPAEEVRVENGELEVDFLRSAFNTRLDLESPSFGQEKFTSSGSISREGYFTASDTNKGLAGAFSMDGREAGYAFRKALSGGEVSGLTLWRR